MHCRVFDRERSEIGTFELRDTLIETKLLPLILTFLSKKFTEITRRAFVERNKT